MDCMRSGQDVRKRVNKKLEQLGEGQEVTGQPALHHRQTTSPSPTAQYGRSGTHFSLKLLQSHYHNECSGKSFLPFPFKLYSSSPFCGDRWSHLSTHTHTSISNLLPVVCQTYSVHGNAICTALCWNCLLHIFSVIFLFNPTYTENPILSMLHKKLHSLAS